MQQTLTELEAMENHTDVLPVTTENRHPKKMQHGPNRNIVQQSQQDIL